MHARSRIKAIWRSGNIYELPARFTSRDWKMVKKWLEAGHLTDVLDIEVEDTGNAQGHYVMIWLEGHSEPVYAIAADGPRWALLDHLNGQRVGNFRTLDAALHHVRPVLPFIAAQQRFRLD